MTPSETRGTVVIGGEGTQRALSAQEEDLALKTLNGLMSALGRLQQYPGINPLVQSAFDECHKNLTRWLRTYSTFECIPVQGALQLNKAFLSAANQNKDFVQAFIFYLTERNIRTLQFKRGLRPEELQRFCEFFARPAKQIVVIKNLPRALLRMGLRCVYLSPELVLENIVVKTALSEDLAHQLNKLNVTELLEKANIISKLDMRALEKVTGLATMVTQLSATKNDEASRRIVSRLAQTLQDENPQSRIASAKTFSQIAEQAVDYTLFGLHSQVGELMTRQLMVEQDPLVYSTLADGLEKTAQEYIALGDYDQAMKIVASFDRQAGAADTRAPGLKKRAENALDRIASPAAINSLISTARGKDETKRATAFDLLTKAGRHAVPQLIDLIYDSPDERAFSAAVEAIVKIGPISLPEIFSEMAEEMDDRYRAAFVRVAGQLGDVHAVIKISPYLLADNERLSIESFRALSHIGGPAAETKIMEGIQFRPPSEELLRTLLHEFGANKNRSLALHLLDFINGKGLLGEYKDSDLQALAARALGQIGGKEVIEGLSRYLTAKKGFLGFGKGDEKVETAVCAALSTCGGEAARPALEKAAKSGPAGVRAAAESALKNLDKKKTAKPESPATTDPPAAVVPPAPARSAPAVAPTVARERANEDQTVMQVVGAAASVAPEPKLSKVRLVLTVGDTIIDNVRVCIRGVFDQGRLTANQRGAEFELAPGEYQVVVQDQGFALTRVVQVAAATTEIRVDLQSIFNF